MQEWLSVKEAAAYLRVGKSTLYNLNHRGDAED
jgi:excisionase family DNA binding protein